MADLRKTYATDIEKEQDGVWSDDLGDGLKLKVARLKNPGFRKLYQRLTKPYERQIRNRTLDDAVENSILSQCLAKTVLLDWQKLVLDGVELTYSHENALKVLSDPGLSDFRDVVVDLANDAELFRNENLEDAEKNLLPGSSGTSSGEDISNSSNE
jgi:hypothetical protein